MENKILRFLELSQEFTIDSKQIFDNDSTNYGFVTISTMSGSTQQVPKTRLEYLTEKLQGEISRAKRFEEYLELRKDLLKYYQALNKLKST